MPTSDSSWAELTPSPMEMVLVPNNVSVSHMIAPVLLTFSTLAGFGAWWILGTHLLCWIGLAFWARSNHWDRHLCSKSWTGQSHAQGFSRTGLDITRGALNAPGQLWTIYGHRGHMLAHGLTGLVCTYIYRTIWLCPYGQSMDYFTTWGQLLYDRTVSEWHVYLQSLWSLSYMHTPSFYTYMYTLLRFRVHVKS